MKVNAVDIDHRILRGFAISHCGLSFSSGSPRLLSRHSSPASFVHVRIQSNVSVSAFADSVGVYVVPWHKLYNLSFAAVWISKLSTVSTSKLYSWIIRMSRTTIRSSGKHWQRQELFPHLFLNLIPVSRSIFRLSECLNRKSVSSFLHATSKLI